MDGSGGAADAFVHQRSAEVIRSRLQTGGGAMRPILTQEA